MWLTRRLFPRQGAKVQVGLVEQENGFAVQGESRYRSPQQLLPYGFSSSAAQGLQAVLLDGYCAGLPNAPDTALEPGEVRLYSAGGAEILLGRDGVVTINGQVFPPKEEE